MTTGSKIEIEISDNGEHGYSLVFDPSDINSSHDGHNWSTIIKNHCIASNVIIDELTFDPESDMFSAYSEKSEPLETLRQAIEQLLSDDELLNSYSTDTNDIEDSDDDMTNEEFVEWMKENGIGNTPQIFEFSFDAFNDKKQAKALESELTELGFNPNIEKIDGEIFFDLSVKIMPDVAELDAIESIFKRLAKQHGVKYLGFGVPT